MNTARNLVSKKKRRYVDPQNGFDLDLSYVNDRIIAMGFPSEKVEAAFRNPMKEVLRFLELKHKDHYKVYNLCSERGYDIQKFYNRVGLFPFDDHNAPPFELIYQFCKDVADWLAKDKENIAVVHCKAGKGRTGLMICAWLLFDKQWNTPVDAMKFYALARTFDMKGVTIPSQIRYIHYFHESLATLGWENPVFEPKILLLTRIVLHTLPKDGKVTDISFTVDVGKTTVFNYKEHVEKCKLKGEPKITKADKKKKATKKTEGEELKETTEDLEEEDTASFTCGAVPVVGDVRVDFDRKGGRIFQFWFNTFFVKENSLTLPKVGLDKAAKDKNHEAYEEKFRVELSFSSIDAPRPKLTSSSSSNILPTVPTKGDETHENSHPTPNGTPANHDPVPVEN